MGWGLGKPEFEGNPIGGMMEMTPDFFPAEVPPHWGVCFEVADATPPSRRRVPTVAQ